MKDICIAGGGPAGMMAGMLFARAGLDVLVLEKHGDFLRDFRGDTVHPSTIDLFRELGLAKALLARPHDEVRTLGGIVGGTPVTIADFGRLPVAHRFIAMMPQWEFLDFLRDEAERWPGFHLEMRAEATELIERDERIGGVTLADGSEVPARLTIIASGRGSHLCADAGLKLIDLGAPIDVYWFRLPKQVAADNRTAGIFATGRILVTIDRGDYWQCALVIPKGGAAALRDRGLEALRAELTALAPALSEAVDSLTGWDQFSLLSVSLNRLERWHRPGLLAIGDAAHAMSPVGGVGINLAIQDAVAAANILAAPMVAGRDPDPLLADVQTRRMLPVRVIQGIQRMAHRNVLGRLVVEGAPLTRPPLPLRILDRCPMLQAIPARLVGLGVRREHIRSPDHLA